MSEANDRDELPSPLRTIVDAAVELERPAPGRMQATWAGIADRSAAGVGPHVAVDVSGVAGFWGGAIGILGKVALAAALVGGGAAAVWAVAREPGPPRSAPTSEPVSTETVPAVVPPVVVPRFDADRTGSAAPEVSSIPDAGTTEVEEAAGADPHAMATKDTEAGERRAPRTRSTPLAASTSATSRLVEEGALLRRAWTALDKGAWAKAATIVARHERDFPRGSLLEEREAVRAILRCDSGRDTDAGSSFERRFSGSIYRSRVRAACRIIDGSNSP